MTLHKKVFYLVLFLIPVNLGKHFIFKWSYVAGLLVDYLIPTIYVVDIFIFILLALWIFEKFAKRASINEGLLPKGFRSADRNRLFLAGFPAQNNQKKWSPLLNILAIFLLCLGLSVISAFNFWIALFTFFKWILYIGFLVYVYMEFDSKKDIKILINIFKTLSLFLCFLALLQWLKQGSLFNNYLFFGEQPYTASTAGIDIENVFGIAKVPPYSLFRHPNAFAGFLAITILWLCFLKKDHLNSYSNEGLCFAKSFFLAGAPAQNKLAKVGNILVLTLGTLSLLLTFSLTGYLAFILGILYLVLIRVFKNIGKNTALTITLTVAVASLLFFGGFVKISKENGSATLFFTSFENDSNDSFLASLENSSLYRRFGLQTSSQALIKERPLFGIGLNNTALKIEEHYFSYKEIRFAQPAHNIFILLFTEAGVITLTTFILLIGLALARSYKHNILLFVSLLQFLVLGSFDHYLLTMHQTLLLFLLTLGIALQYN